MMNRRKFLQGGLSLMSLTPLIPITGVPQIGLPLPFATAAPAGTIPNSPSATTPSAYLGVIGPQNGAQLELAQQLQNGVRGAIHDANALHGTLDRTYDLHLFDDLGDPSDAPNAANSLISDPGVLVAIGHLGNATTNAALPTYAQAQIPLLVPTATADSITQHGYRNVFRLATRDGREGQLFARHLLHEHTYKNVAIITLTDGYGPDVARAFAAEAHALKIPYSLTQIPIIPDEQRIATSMTSLLRAKPDLVFFAGTSQNLATSFQQLMASGYQGTSAASQGFFDMGTITKLGKAAEGLLVSTSVPPLGQNAAQHLEIQTYNEQYGQLTPIAAFAYAAAQIAITAIGRIGAVSRAPIIQAIAQGGTFTTIAGDFRFDAFGDPTDPNLYFYKVLHGTWIEAGSLRQARFHS